MASRALRPVAAAALLFGRTAAFGNMCTQGHPDEGSCLVDGTGCSGESVEFLPYSMDFHDFDNTSGTSSHVGQITSYAIKGRKDTWEMYLHGPHIHERERANEEDLPPMYVFATFMNKIYRFENFTRPRLAADGTPEPLRAVQKVVGHVLAPSTGYVLESDEDMRPRGLLVAEGQPFWFSNVDTMPPKEIYKGGVEYLPRHPYRAPDAPAPAENCTQLFPVSPVQKMLGQVVNTVDCHKGAGVCFFSVWKFYDDQFPIWTKMSEFFADDCLFYCIASHNDKKEPVCLKTAVVVDENGEQICHKDGVGAVHGMTVGNTDPEDPMKFDLLLVFTGKATLTNGESSMRKVSVRVVGEGDARDFKVLKSAPFGLDLFQRYPPKGFDVGGDHAWVDATGKHVWVSCFREKGVGVHMLDYESGRLLHSITGLDKYIPNQYTYTAGIHGVGSLGQKGSYLVVASCSCHDITVCIPIVPWAMPVPEQFWSTGVFFIIDLSSMVPLLQTVHV
eukprot:CAMPEP_0204528484 /NCGR_PEP_ID=MMETSP0661-20131031/9556_1 /ASSEMBLY_ACC=CAM_ASM_000606 /TAXON_ID=109239 /ORGANISM="Alexandrium margalefi, Strain AMGDE01CS-322" /LENGTH=502 /DNA_ID=CAMNT_0051534465 /DNA_START=58 /DNA_END=1566 /DNA_ORIENTATION=-